MKSNIIFEIAKFSLMTKLLTLLFLAAAIPVFAAGNPPESDLNPILVNKVMVQGRAPGQPPKMFRNVSLGGAIGPSWFMGDLADHKVFPAPRDWGNTIGYNWSLYLRKEFEYGMAAKLQFDKGDLQGGRVIGDASPRVDFETEYKAIHLQFSYNLLEAVFGDRNRLRFYLLGEVGIGLTFYRSLTYWGEGPPLVRDFEGYSTTDLPPTQRYANMERAPMAHTINIPIGLTFGHMLNHRVDVTAQVMLNNVLTDRLETWARDQTSRDKYGYIQVGMRYNFNRTERDMPTKRRSNRSNRRSSRQDRDNVTPNQLELGDKLKPIKGFKGSSSASDKEMLEALMRMYELQLHLFQLQYLTRDSK